VTRRRRTGTARPRARRTAGSAGCRRHPAHGRADRRSPCSGRRSPRRPARRRRRRPRERLVVGALRGRHEIAQAEHLSGDLRKLVAEIRQWQVVEDDVAQAPEGRAVVLAQDRRHGGCPGPGSRCRCRADAVLLVVHDRGGAGAVVDQLVVRPQLQDAGDRTPAQAHREGAGVGVLIDEAALAGHRLALVLADLIGPDQVARHARVAVDLRDRRPIGRGADLQVLEARTFAREQEAIPTWATIAIVKETGSAIRSGQTPAWCASPGSPGRRRRKAGRSPRAGHR
jgi:hypothetical protein